jgi:hypothetical protein
VWLIHIHYTDAGAAAAHTETLRVCTSVRGAALGLVKAGRTLCILIAAIYITNPPNESPTHTTHAPADAHEHTHSHSSAATLPRASCLVPRASCLVPRASCLVPVHGAQAGPRATDGPYRGPDQGPPSPFAVAVCRCQSANHWLPIRNPIRDSGSGSALTAFTPRFGFRFAPASPPPSTSPSTLQHRCARQHHAALPRACAAAAPSPAVAVDA